MKPSNKIWINGKIAGSNEAKLFSFHQGLNYGAAVYDGIRCYKTKNGHAIFRLDEHVNRFFYSASVLNMKLGYTKEEMKKAIRDLVKANKLQSGYIRPMAFYSEPKMGINIFDTKLTFVIFAWAWDETKPSKPTSLYITKYTRLSPKSVDLKAKISGYYANGLLGFIDAKKSGYDQPLFLDERGYVAEGAISNIFVVKKGILYTPTTRNILSGMTRDTVIKIARNLKIKVVERDILPRFLKDAEEIFLTGTGIQIQPVSEIKGYFISHGKTEVIDRISARYNLICRA